MDSRKAYEAPEAEVILFDREDVIRTSTPSTDTATPRVPVTTYFNVY
ncbi:MAG: hypothetical protein IJP86_00650 [Synergistaceae bacterium]|nr:hypothetical protein [Synergistaceae bacterium]